MKGVIHDMKVLGESQHAKEIYQGKAYNHIPDIVDKLVMFRAFRYNYHKKSFARVEVGASGSQIKSIGRIAPTWRK